MSHENSTTTQLESGKWVNINDNGGVLEPILDDEKLEYDTVIEATALAKKRSASFREDDITISFNKTLSAREKQNSPALAYLEEKDLEEADDEPINELPFQTYKELFGVDVGEWSAETKRQMLRGTEEFIPPEEYGKYWPGEIGERNVLGNPDTWDSLEELLYSDDTNNKIDENDDELGILQQGWQMIPEPVQDVLFPFVAPFVVGSNAENPIIRGAIAGTVDAAQGIVDLGKDVTNYLFGHRMEDEITEEDWLTIPRILESNPDSMTEGVVRGLSQFMSVFGVLGGVSKNATLLKQTMAAAFSDATFDPTHGNLSTFLREIDIDNSLTQFLDSSVDNDAEAVERLQGRLKSVLEGAGIGFTIPIVFGLLKRLKTEASPIIKEFLEEPEMDYSLGSTRDYKKQSNVHTQSNYAPPSTTGYHRSSAVFTEVDSTKRNPGQMGKGHYIDTDKSAAEARGAGNYLYTQELPHNIDETSISWDRTPQSDFVTKAFKDIEKEIGFKLDLEDNGIDVYPALVEKFGEDEAQKILLRHGITGNRRGTEYSLFSPLDVKTTYKDSMLRLPTNAKVAIPAGMGVGSIQTNEVKLDNVSDIIKSFERYSGEGYYATKAEEKKGLVTAGWGATRKVKRGVKVSKKQADKWLKEDIESATRSVDSLVKVDLNQNQKNALISLVYNIGHGNFKKSKALKALNKGNIKKFLIEAFDSKIGFVRENNNISKGLIKRRAAERKIFNKGGN